MVVPALAAGPQRGQQARRRLLVAVAVVCLFCVASVLVFGGSALGGGVVSGSVARTPGTVWAWGAGGHGELGNGRTDSSETPLRVSNLSGVVAVAAGTGDAGYTTYALLSNGTVWAWGLGASGQLGDGSKAQLSDLPVEVHGLARVVAVAAGGDQGYALRKDGTVWAWGRGGYGELGNGKQSSLYMSAVPVEVHNLARVVAIAASGASAYALRRDGSVWASGYGYQGQFGNGSTGSGAVYE